MLKSAEKSGISSKVMWFFKKKSGFHIYFDTSGGLWLNLLVGLQVIF